jgi:IclR family KDG regulon transcriptional repressor
MTVNPSVPRKLYRVQSLDRALNIVECFDFRNEKLSLAELAKKTGLNKTTVLRLASNLVNRGYLKFDPDTASYSLGMKFFELGSIIFSSFSLRKASSRHMTELQRKTSATVLLGIHMDDQLVYLDKREGEGAIRIASEIGWRRSPHYGMLGMVLMAGLTPERRTELLNKYPLQSVTSRTVTDLQSFLTKLARIADDDYVVERGEAVDGLIGIAAPIRDYSQNVVSAVGVAILEAQHNEYSVTQVLEAVRFAARNISAELGYRKF